MCIVILPGQYYDSETGLHYNYHRYYDPTSGRYLRSDPVGLKAGLCLYLYSQNNPIMWPDKFGLESGGPFRSSGAATYKFFSDEAESKAMLRRRKEYERKQLIKSLPWEERRRIEQEEADAKLKRMLIAFGAIPGVLLAPEIAAFLAAHSFEVIVGTYIVCDGISPAPPTTPGGVMIKVTSDVLVDTINMEMESENDVNISDQYLILHLLP